MRYYKMSDIKGKIVLKHLSFVNVVSEVIGYTKL